ncbi:Formate hydrogenlyase subunit 4 [bioreactor metagenome]|uniref:Formate hydrogenlyase subunit 4 n=1 Tax=bioreactor metagenome TaxID=1076179 RepID=A0A645A016_9ZZZZ
MLMINTLISAFIIVAIAPLIEGIVRTVKARLQNRRGPSIWQPYYDLAKFFAKDSVVSPTVSWVFGLAPYIYFATAFAAAGVVAVAGPFSRLADILILVYLLGLGRFFLALASLDAGSAFGGMGGSREMFVAILVEPALLLALVSVAFKADTMVLSGMSATAASLPLSLPYALSAIAFFIVLIAETGRIPVDNPDTHLELTMIHEGMILEYSGRSLGLIHLASMAKQTLVLMLFVAFFVPWQPPGLSSIGLDWVWGLIKLVLAAALLAIVETSTNKMRLFKLPGFLAVSCLLSLLALVAQ